MATIQLCDQTGCKEAATHSYTWEWGASGTCCALHQTTLQQTARNLERTIQFGVLSPEATPPLQREERVRLKAAALVLEEEIGELKQRSLEMYRQNLDLTQQVQSLTVRHREAEAQRREAILARDEMDERLRVLEAENSELANELARVRVLLPIAPLTSAYPEDSGTQPGVG